MLRKILCTLLMSLMLAAAHSQETNDAPLVYIIPVRKIMGMLLVRSSAFNARTTSPPLISGMTISSRIRSGFIELINDLLILSVIQYRQCFHRGFRLCNHPFQQPLPVTKVARDGGFIKQRRRIVQIP